MTKEITPIEDVDTDALARAIMGTIGGNSFFAVVIGPDKGDGEPNTRVISNVVDLQAVAELLAELGLQMLDQASEIEMRKLEA